MVLRIVDSLLSLIPRTLCVQRVSTIEDRFIVEAKPYGDLSKCPTCSQPSRRIHSTYVRTVRDLPTSGRQVLIRAMARRFRCLNTGCARQTFAERLDDVAAYARRTERLGELQRYLALVLGGEAGARLAARIAVPVSADTLLRMAIATVPRREPIRTPRVLAVDDWAWRRGHRYGSILVDLERNQVIDLLPDRQAETVADWLLRHPGVEVVARDRAGAYADGVSQGAPSAVQVADRWHLLRNLGDAIHAVVEKHYTALCRLRTELMTEVTADSPREMPTAITTATERRKLEAYARRQARYEEAAQLKAVGLSITAIAKQIGADRKTIVGWLRAGAAPLWRKPPRATMLDPYHEHLDRRWREGCRNAAQLWRELVTVGFAGNAKVVSEWAGRRRRSTPFGANAANRAVPPPSSRRVTRLLMANHDLPRDAEQDLITRALAQMPELAQCVAARPSG